MDKHCRGRHQTEQCRPGLQALRQVGHRKIGAFKLGCAARGWYTWESLPEGVQEAHPPSRCSRQRCQWSWLNEVPHHNWAWLSHRSTQSWVERSFLQKLAHPVQKSHKDCRRRVLLDPSRNRACPDASLQHCSGSLRCKRSVPLIWRTYDHGQVCSVEGLCVWDWEGTRHGWQAQIHDFTRLEADVEDANHDKDAGNIRYESAFMWGLAWTPSSRASDVVRQARCRVCPQSWIYRRGVVKGICRHYGTLVYPRA